MVVFGYGRIEQDRAVPCDILHRSCALVDLLRDPPLPAEGLPPQQRNLGEEGVVETRQLERRNVEVVVDEAVWATGLPACCSCKQPRDVLQRANVVDNARP